MIPNSYLKQKNIFSFFSFLILFSFLTPTRSIGQAINDSCYQAIEVFCGESRLVDFGGYNPNAYDRFDDCNYYSYNESVWFKVTGTGEIINVSLCNYSVEVKVFEGSCDSLICYDNYMDYYGYNCTNSSSEIGFKSEIGKVYYLYCNTFNSEAQSSLYINCISPADNNFCESAKYIVPDSFYQHNHLEAYPSNHPSCQSFYTDTDADTWYTFLGTGEILKLEYERAYAITRLIKGDCENYECVDHVDIDLLTSIGYQTELGETYYLRFHDRETDTVSFKLSPIIRHPADKCENALVFTLKDTFDIILQNTITEDLVCASNGTSSDIWYSFIGNDSIIRINLTGKSLPPEVKILTGDCTAVNCEIITRVNQNNYNFHTEKGQHYFLNFTNRRSYSLKDTFHVATSYIASPTNDTYLNAIALNCTDTISGSIINALADKAINRSDYPSVWYKIVGSDNFYTFPAYCTGSTSKSLSRQLYTLSENELEVYDNKFAFPYLEKDSTYYLNVVSWNALDSFIITAECQPVVENDICTTAKLISISDTIRANTFFTLIDETPNCGFANENINSFDTWFHLKGDGKLYNFTFKRPRNQQQFAIFKGACDSLICIDYSYNNIDSVTNSIFLEDQTDYYIIVFNIYGWESRNFEFYFKELSIASNDLCPNARLLSCGDIVIDSLNFAVANDTFCEVSSINSYTRSKGVWYQLEGANNYIEIYFPDSNTIPMEYVPSFFEGNCTQLSCMNDQLRIYRKKYVFWGEAGKNYYMVFQGQQKFKFEVLCFDRETNDLVDNAIPLNCGEQITGYGFFANEESTDYCSYPIYTKDLWWKIEGNDQFLYVDDLAAYYDNVAGRFSSVHVYRNGNLECLENFQNRIFLIAGTTYYLRYGLSNTSAGHYDFNLKFSCSTPPVSDECIGALVLNCGDTLTTNDQHTRNDTIYHTDAGTTTIIPGGTWVKITGDNTFKELSARNIDGSSFNGNFQYFKGDDCGTLSIVPELVGSYDYSVFYAVEGVNYYAVISGNNNFFKLTSNCVEQAVNDYCHAATPISCGDTMNASLNYAYNCDYGDGGNCHSEKRLWYTIEGTGDIVELDFKSSSFNAFVTHVEIYYNNCCQKRGVPNVYGTKHLKRFQSKLGESYLIGISLERATKNDGKFSLTVNCVNDQYFNICENAISLNNQQVVNVDVSKAISYYFTDAFLADQPVSWVSFIGSGGMDTLIFSAQNLKSINIDTYIDFEESCWLNHLYTYYIGYLAAQNKIVFSTIKGVKYLVAFNEGADYRNEIDTIGILLKHAETPTCKIALEQDTFWVDYNKSLSIKILPNTLNGITDASIREGSSYNSLYNGAISFVPKTEGQKVVQFYTEDPFCWGHDYFYLKFNNPPVHELECPDSTITCQEYIDHEEETLNSNYFKSSSTITSNAHIKRQAKVVYMATEEVKLTPGFHAKTGSDFTAFIDACLSDEAFGNQEQTNSLATDVEESQLRTESSDQYKNDLIFTIRPNPFASQLLLTYTLPESETIRIVLYTINGQKIQTILSETRQVAGVYNHSIDGQFLDTGIYFLELLTSKQRIQKKIVKIQ